MRGGDFRSRILCFSRFWNRLKMLEDELVLEAPGFTTRNKKLLGAPGIATRGSWPYY